MSPTLFLYRRGGTGKLSVWRFKGDACDDLFTVLYIYIYAYAYVYV